MCDVRKSVVRLFLAGVTAGLLLGAMTHANAQDGHPYRVHRETNAIREARIQRTIKETYAHRFEVFGGGGFLRFRPGEYLKKDNQISWAASTTYYFDPKFGVIASAQGSFGNAQTLRGDSQTQAYVPQALINEYYFLVGPSYRFYAKEKIALSVHAQGGIGWGIFEGGAKQQQPADTGLWSDSSGAAFSLGINGDYNFYPNLAFRVTPTYIGTTFDGKMQNNVGFNAGFVYRFGH
jgi:hypothetical protein